MTTPTCARCGSTLADGAVVCRRPCASALAQRLTEAAGHAEDAWTVIARQTRYGGAGGGGHGDTTTPNLKASAVYARFANTVGDWAQRLLDAGAPEPEPWRPTLGPLCPPRRPADGPPAPGQPWQLCAHPSCAPIRAGRPSAVVEACMWLATQTDQLRRHPEAGRAFRELDSVCIALEQVVDRPAGGKRLVGMCDCGQILYAPQDRPVIQCKGRPRSCGATWDVEKSQAILLRHLDEQLVTVPEALDMAGWLDTDRTREQIRKLLTGWIRTGQVAAHGSVWREPTEAELRDDPQAPMVAVPTYRFGEIRQRLADTPRREQRQREGAAA